MVLKVQEVLEKIEKENEVNLKSTTVEKSIELEHDLGNLLTTDTNPHDTTAYRNEGNDYLMRLARDNAQLLFNEIWKLPIERIQEAVIVKLPPSTTTLPREKPIPKPKPLTKWEEFAKLKGIKKKKKSRKVWDEATKSWKPRWGYDRAGDTSKEWVLEVPKNADPNEDQFEKRAKEKREKVAKNELQRLRNMARRKGKKVPGVGETMTANDDKSISQLSTAFHLAKQSTASLGRFENSLRDEKPVKGKKRKFDPLVGNGSTEKQRQLKIISEIQKKTPSVNVNKAVNQQLGHQEAKAGGKRKASGDKGGGKKMKKMKRSSVGAGKNKSSGGKKVGVGKQPIKTRRKAK